MRSARPAVGAVRKCPSTGGRRTWRHVFEVDAIEDVLARAQQANLGVRGQPGLRRRDRAADAASVGKSGSRGSTRRRDVTADRRAPT